MPAATTKEDLLEVSQKEFSKLLLLLEKLPSEVINVKDHDQISIKDIISHRSHWIGLFLGWYQDGQDGKQVAFPAAGYKWNQLKSYNQMVREKYQHVSWDEACERLRAQHQTFMALLDGLSDQALYGGPMKGGRNQWTTGRWAEAAGASHYRSAAKYIRKRQKDLLS